LSAARRELRNGFGSQRPSGPGAWLAARAPAPKPRSTAPCGLRDSLGASSANTNKITHIATTATISTGLLSLTQLERRRALAGCGRRRGARDRCRPADPACVVTGEPPV